MKRLKRSFVFCAVTFATGLALGQTNIVYTWRNFVGQPGVGGTNDGIGRAALFSLPGSVAVDSTGTVYVDDMHNHAIRKVTAAGVVTTLAGLAGTSGTNDGTGTAARFNTPGDVTVDNAGTLYVADTYNFTIRQLTQDGVVTTLAGCPGVYGSADGTNDAARFALTAGVAVDAATNLYVADCQNCTIRKVTRMGTNWVVTTIAGNAGAAGTNDGTGASARFGFLQDVAVDAVGNLYVADGNYTIRKVTPVGTNWVVTTIAGKGGSYGTNDGPGSVARFRDPVGVAVDSAGNIFVPDRGASTIRKVTPMGTNWVVTTIGGTAQVPGSADGIGNAAGFYGPYGVGCDAAGRVYVVDTHNDRISKGLPTPTMAATRLGANVRVSWPSFFTIFELQQNGDSGNASGWRNSIYGINDDGTNRSITVTSPTDRLFFRLVGN